ncbi:hypothetical protein AAVH_31491 [Aphelenchoides avenae]|nr:hypothetical protein AAVH_31491 [Aphelenchus avenae]
MLISIVLLLITSRIRSVPAQNDYAESDAFHISLTEEELRGISELEPDEEDSHDTGQFMNDFFHDSQSQLVVDLDMIRQIWHETEKYREAATDGDIDYLQAVVDFFEPLKNYDVSAPCLADMFHFLWTTYKYAHTAQKARQCTDCNCTTAFRSDFTQYQWIFDVVDSIGKVPAAIFGGNNLWTGSWYTCRKVSSVKNVQGQSWNGQYCMARFQPYNRHNPLKAFVAPQVDPAEVCKSNSTGEFEEWSADDKKCFDLLPLLNLGLCTPDTCTDYDVKRIIQFLYHSAELSSGKRLVCNVEVQCSNSRPESLILNDTLSVTVLCFMLVVLSLMIFGTCYDLYIARPLKEEIRLYHTGGLYAHDDRKRSVLPKGPFVTTLMLFSVARNLEYIMETKEAKAGQIRCLHGARFLSMCWIIFGHTYYYICTSLTMDNLIPTLREFPTQFYNQIVVQAPLAVDSFFFLSGLLTAYIFLGKLKKNKIRLTAWTTWFAYYVRRYIRLTPVYVVVMVLEVTLFSYISEGPFWRPIEPNYCRNSWWTNLLYVNNFFKQDDPCMGWTWYMANDFQFYMFAPILIVLLHYHKNGGIVVGVVTIVASSVATLYITLLKGYPAAPLLTVKLDIVSILNEYWVDLYVKPYTRCGPYIIGCIVGHLLLEKRETFRLSRIQWCLGWIVGSSLGIYSVFGLFNYSKTGEISQWWHILYTLAGRPAFALFLGWITFACETDHAGKINAILGHKIFVPLSKLTFCAYLLHPILLQTYYLSRPTAFHFTHSFQLLYMFFVAVTISYSASLAFSLAFEMPVLNVDKLIFGDGEPRKAPRRQVSKDHDAVAMEPMITKNGTDPQEVSKKTSVDESDL